MKCAPRKLRPDDPQRSSTPSIRTCSTCHRDISTEIYIKCARCPGFDQCLECFSIGSESQFHIRSHPFLLLDPVLSPIFQHGWSADQEIQLLNSIQICGLGNWQEISDLLKTKTALECECHYFATYIDCDPAPSPPPTLLPECQLPPPPPFDTAPRESRPSISHERNLAELNKRERTTPAEFAGWMPKRSEFEFEYLNDAEQIISGLGFSEGEDNAASIEQKLEIMRVYYGRIAEREVRTKFAVEWDLLANEFRSFGGRTLGECELEEIVMPLAQVLPREVLTGFVHSLQSELRLKEQIETYKKWHRNGIVTHDEGILFNQLQALVAEERLTPSVVEKWNRDVMVYAESPEFRATLDRQLLSDSENQLCQNFGISPHSYLRIKDLLLREFTAHGEMTREIAVAFMPSQEHIMVAIYDSLAAVGLFCRAEDLDD